MKKLYLLSLICILGFSNSFCQTTQLGNNAPGLGTPFLGWNSVNSMILHIKTEYADPINFYTYAAATGAPNLANMRMQIYDSQTFPYNQGFIGMGLLNPPRLNLEVQSNIGLIPLVWNEGYYIDSVPILRSWPLGANMNNIFVGKGAGFNAANTGSGLTFVGNDAGLNNTSGIGNTFIGFETGTAITTESNNTYVGHQAGINSSNGERNTFIGSQTGTINTGDDNTFAGGNSGNSNTIGKFNSFFGVGSGGGNTTGEFNTFMGNSAGLLNVSGSNNSLFGYRAGESITGSGNTIFGSEASIDQDFGDSNVVMGSNAVHQAIIIENSVVIGSGALPNNYGQSRSNFLICKKYLVEG